METTLDKFGRIVIPKKVREDFNLKAGAQIRIEKNEQTIILKPIHDVPNLILKDGVLVFSGLPIGDLENALKKHRENRTKNLGAKSENPI